MKEEPEEVLDQTDLQPKGKGKGEKKGNQTSEKPEECNWVGEAEKTQMVRVATYFGMSLGAFVFWQSMEKVHVWIALHQDEKKERLNSEAEIRRMREELLHQAKQNERLA
ncbi:hypothetical protein Goshw_025741 [Gossypium schwendimanii]|uniref:Uncharacterized protein n=1 Tax=Gossypium schwendimanii TaxID=34291 RepID=A0A7J9KUE4_GOSSC|nr:hypothetical protein [Gossypium schwendimanii]